jgi:putative acetyltransferase
MEPQPIRAAEAAAVEAFFTAVFTASESEQEGQLVGHLARRLAVDADGPDVHGYALREAQSLVGAVFFSRLTCDPAREAVILSPLAVAGTHQGQGLGTRLVTHGLAGMERRGVTFVATYGDPAFYGRAGFQPIPVDVIRPPYDLSQPHGWLGRTFGELLSQVRGSVRCVPALSDPVYW